MSVTAGCVSFHQPLNANKDMKNIKIAAPRIALLLLYTLNQL